MIRNSFNTFRVTGIAGDFVEIERDCGTLLSLLSGKYGQVESRFFIPRKQTMLQLQTDPYSESGHARKLLVILSYRYCGLNMCF